MSWLDQQYKNTQTVQDGRVDGRGLGAFLWQQFVDEDKLNKDKQRIENQNVATSKGESLDDLDIKGDPSTYDVQGAVIKKKRERAEKTSQTNYERSREPAREQLKLTREQGNQTHSLALLQMADNADARLADREYQRSRDRKEDMRYNERMEQLDRKDRKSLYATLATGLASLGAAFAL